MWYIKYCRSVLLWIAVFAAVHSSRAQSYYHTPGDTFTGFAMFQDVNVFNIIQVHPAADTLYFKWHKQSVDMPASWEASICDNGNCYTSLMDSGSMVPIVPGDDGLMSLHLDPKTVAGTGIIRYSLYAANSAAQVDTLTWIITAGSPSGLSDPKAQRPVVYVSGYQVRCRNLQGLYNQASLYDLNGRLLVQQQVTGDEAILPVAHYNARMFILKLSGKRNFITKVLNQ